MAAPAVMTMIFTTGGILTLRSFIETDDCDDMETTGLFYNGPLTPDAYCSDRQIGTKMIVNK